MNSLDKFLSALLLLWDITIFMVIRHSIVAEIYLDRSKTVVILHCVLQSSIYLCDFFDMLNIYVMYV